MCVGGGGVNEKSFSYKKTDSSVAPCCAVKYM